MPPEVPRPEVPAQPRVSVVLVAFNCESPLRRALSALEASRERDSFEILVVDAGSSDNSRTIDTEFEKIQLLRLPRNFGRTRARNLGVRNAMSDLICFLDPYVVVRPDTISTLAAALEARPDATAAAPVLEDPGGNPIPTTSRLPSRDELALSAFTGQPLPRTAASETPEAVDETALLVRKNFLAGMNYLDEKRFSEHWSLLDLCWQIRNAGRHILLVDRARATLHPDPDAVLDDDMYTSDRISGAAAYLSKHNGFFTGIFFRIRMLLKSLGAFRLRLALSVLTGDRIDPTQ